MRGARAYGASAAMNGREVLKIHGVVQRCNRSIAVVALGYIGKSRGERFGLSFAKVHSFRERWAESRASQVVRLSLEDAISRKAVGSPD